MRRRTFDALATAAGLLIAIVLLVAGGLLTWAHSYVNDQVHSQLAAQQIYFPAQGNSELASPKIGPYLNQYAGQQLLTGTQARAYADHFIAVHLSEMPYGGVYSKVSNASRANPNNAALKAEVTTVFQGTTLRGLLLNAYAFATMGTIAGIAAIVSFVAAGLMLILSALGLWHLRRVPPTEELQLGSRGRAPAGV